MLKNTKCECGHQNPVGTVLCEACGIPIEETEAESNAPLEMRYEGAARRSQKRNPNILDRVWNFFSSVKVAVYLIIITLFLAMFGTFLPQVNVVPSNDKQAYYVEEYGFAGQLYYSFGLADTFGSWWFKTLVVLIAASLIICSLDRIIPLYRALKKQQAKKHEKFLTRQRVLYTTEVAEPEEWLQQAEQAMKSRRYKLMREDNALLAEKNRFSRWGPYINHVGLIILLIALLTRGIPGWFMSEGIGLSEGEIGWIPGTEYYLENIEFTEAEEVGPHISGQQLIPTFATEAVLYRCVEDCNNPLKEPVLEEVLKHTIRPNEPLVYDDYSIYQIDYEFLPQATEITFGIVENGQESGTIAIDLSDPQSQYEAGGWKFELSGYYPDLVNISGEPATKSRLPNNPAFILEATDANGMQESYFLVPFQNYYTRISGNEDTAPLEFVISGMNASRYDSYLLVRVEKALPYVLAGSLIFLFGVVIGLYWQHRRIWVRLDGRHLTIAAHTNKNWYGMREELSKILKKTGIEVDAKSLDNNEVSKA